MKVLTRQCKICQIVKEASEFDRDPKGVVIRKECKACRIEKRKKFDSRFGPGLRKRRLVYKYGITVEDYDRMQSDQNNLCLLCCRPNKNFWGNNLVIDHCHKTGKVRGLLCDKCNKGLGQFEDSIKVLQKAIKYLKRQKI